METAKYTKHTEKATRFRDARTRLSALRRGAGGFSAPPDANKWFHRLSDLEYLRYFKHASRSVGWRHNETTKFDQPLIMPDQAQKTRPVPPGSGGGGDGPSSPKVDKPNTEELLKRMRKVDPDQAKRYRQRTGQ